MVLADLSRDGQEIVAAVGGAGGRGNMQFRTGTNRAPRQFTFGEEGEQKWVELELRYEDFPLFSIGVTRASVGGCCVRLSTSGLLPL